MLRLALIAAIVIALAFVLRQRSAAQRQAPAIGSSGADDTAGDRQTLRALRDAGADLTKATEVNFYLYLPTEAAARQAAEQGTTPELRADVQPAAQGPGWLCLLSGEMVPSEQSIRAARTRLEALAAALGGEYDGWEAAVTR